MHEHEQELQRIVLRDPEVDRRLHFPRKVASHLARRGFQTALGFSTPQPPLTWIPLCAPSMIHGHAWLGLDRDTLQKTLVLQCLPPKIKRPTMRDAWEYAGGKCRSATLEGQSHIYYQEARLDESHLLLRDPLHTQILIPAGQRCQTHTGPHLKIRCAGTKNQWLLLQDATGKPIPNPNRCA